MPVSQFASLRLLSGNLPSPDCFSHYISSESAPVPSVSQDSPCFTVFVAPACLVPYLNCPQLRELLRVHNVPCPRASRGRESMIQLVLSHVCDTSCACVFYVFSPACLAITAQCTSPPLAQPLPVASFPPSPLSVAAKAAIVSDWCENTSSTAVSESPCAVCASLTLRLDLHLLADTDVDLSPLIRPNVTREERFHASDPIRSLPGPILFEGGVTLVDNVRTLAICPPCLNVLRRHSLPARSLANGRWVGNVPSVLRGLSYSEELMIARYRHSFCVAQVSRSQQRYLAANVIVFGQPVDRMYDVLPPPRSDIEACLAILFVGSAKPTDDDVRHTPFLVRRNKVLTALNWLKLNHPLYAAVDISYDNLNGYPEDSPPVGIVFRPRAPGSSAESLAVYENVTDRETSEGDAPFIVHGLDGADLARMSYDSKIAIAIRHFDDGHAALAYGHDPVPETIYHNSKLFPGMFPWLYPYGRGGFENEHISKKLDRKEHIRHCLMYSQRTFATDRCFPFIVFNQEQIRSSSQGGYLLTSRKNFSNVADRLLTLDRSALDALIERSADGAYVQPETDDEKACFELIAFVDHVAGHVEGSSTARKYQRNEIRSLIFEKGVPSFFITFAPADYKNPLCLYYCGEPIDLLVPTPALPSSDARLRAIASNPVGAARFFNKCVQLFIRCILRHDSSGPGLLGDTEAYYGTVEAQGRLTLHLHSLIWIKNSLSPQDIRDRLLADPVFEHALLAWLEDCQTGDFSARTGTELSDALEEDYVKTFPDGTTRICRRLKRSVRDPATTLPVPPPENADDAALETWYSACLREADEIVFCSNRHDPTHGKGCWRGDETDGYCKARFPRELFESTQVDRASGAIRFGKSEPWINTYHPVASYLMRYNSDFSCLLSGTQVKAIVAYVTDYITKNGLTTHTFFEVVRAVLDRNTEMLNEAGSDRDRVARSIIVKIVNALSAASEIGGPAVCAYLLGQPDHYTSEKFRVFYWYAYIQHFVNSSTPLANSALDHPDDRVMLGLTTDGVVVMNKVNDYVFRPASFAGYSLYDFMRVTDVRKLNERDRFVRVVSAHSSDPESEDFSDSAEDDAPHSSSAGPPARAHRFLTGHPLRKTHGVFLRDESAAYVLNFVGRALPRPDKGDREEYCATMLAFFHPAGWRCGRDLLPFGYSWSQTFERTVFSPTTLRVMKNMNVMYECLDARDDYSALRRAEGKQTRGSRFAFGGFGALHDAADSISVNDGVHEFTEQSLVDLLEDGTMGKKTAKTHKEMAAMSALLPPGPLVEAPPIRVHVRKAFPTHSASRWKSILLEARTEAFQRLTNPRNDSTRTRTLPLPRSDLRDCIQPLVSVVTLAELSAFFPRSSSPASAMQDPDILLLHSTIQKFSLNAAQTRAFRIAATHLHHHDPKPLRMYLGGMAGTGKSRVLLSLVSFLDASTLR